VSKNKKLNPHCPVLGCGTKQPHSAIAIVSGLLRKFSEPAELALWAKTGIAETEKFPH
jgi:hypothetical protein